jgi:serine/threonine-protein kinase
MALTVGTQLGSHEITALLGKGGMGEVYRARDLKLKREVAIKILPEEFSRDADRVIRFQREAEVLASLNHPNIAGIYDLAEASGTRFLVLELVEGETLADRIARGPIPVEEALIIAKQICEALEAAHERGIIHRDLKPTNVKLAPGGKVKVLDFGLAKALRDVSGSTTVSNSPTLVSGSMGGVILGTAPYMSPEQARGKQVDARTDIWAFGCVLFEMLTGQQTFTGETTTDVLAKVLEAQPKWDALPPETSSSIRFLLETALNKDPKQRLHHIADVRPLLNRPSTLDKSATTMVPAAPGVLSSKQKLYRILPWTAAALALGALLAWLVKPVPLPEPRPVVRFDYELPEGQEFRGIARPVVAFSSDGRYFVYNTNRGLYLRSMDTLEARLIPGTEPALTNPFFSPDGEWVGYFGPPGELKKISIGGGAPVTLCKASNPFGVSWNADGTILFGQPAGILRVLADGGEPKLVIPTGSNELAYGPEMLPDGETILFSLSAVEGEARWDQAQIVVQSLKSGKRKVVLQGGSDAHYAPSGHLTYAVGNVLYAVPFDLKKLEVVGGAVPLIQDVERPRNPGNATASANYGFSNRGTLVYLAFAPNVSTLNGLARVDLNGVVQRLNVPPDQYHHPRVSPDGKSLTVETVAQNGQSSIWIYDLAETTARRRLMPEDASYTRPIWTPDSKKITFFSDREKPPGIYSQLADGSGLPERLTSAENGELQFPESWSPDGRTLSLAVVKGDGGIGVRGDWSLWTLSRAENKLKPFYDRPNSNQIGSAFSPDGNWIAYFSNEERQFGIYLLPFPPTGVPPRQISRSGGAWPVWSPKGTELFYRLNVGGSAALKGLNKVTITTKPFPSFSSETPLPLPGFIGFQYYRDYDMMPNGKEFLTVFPTNQTASREPPRPRFEIVLNWFTELQKRVPVK